MCSVPTKKRVEEVLDYNPDTGVFIRISSGAEIKANRTDGYRSVGIDGKIYLCHRLAFLIMGQDVPEFVDHINGDRGDNSWCNLRPATKSLNGCNSKIPSSNTSGVKGVTWHKGSQKWMARIKLGGKTTHLGRFTKLSDAEEVVRMAREDLHKEFARHE